MSHDSQPGRIAVVLLSGGLDSAVCVASAAREGFRVHALSIDYGQRHKHELRAAASVARQLGVSRHLIIPMDLRGVGGSALTSDVPVPKGRSADAMKEIPVTYVPARNLTFLALAVGYAEVCSARDVYIGVNAVDYSGYPDCRPEFIASFEQTARLATKAGVQSAGVKIRTPLQGLSKAEIVRLGATLGVDFSLTTSCYDPTDAGLSCGQCDACVLRRKGFQDAGVPDPTRYAGTLHASPAGAQSGRQGNVQAWG